MGYIERQREITGEKLGAIARDLISISDSVSSLLTDEELSAVPGLLDASRSFLVFSEKMRTVITAHTVQHARRSARP